MHNVTELIVSVSRDDTGLERNHWLTVGYGYARGNRDQIDIRRTGHVIIISRICQEHTSSMIGTYPGHDPNMSTTRSEHIEDQIRAYRGYDHRRYIRTLIHVLSLVLRDQFKSISIGYLLVSDSSALNQQPSIRARLALFLYSLPLQILLVDYLTEPGGGDIPIDAYDLRNRTRRGIEHTTSGRHLG